MQVTINIDENKFAEVIEKELKALSSDQLQEIIVSAIQKYFEENADDLIRDLLIRKDYYSNKSEPTEFMRKIAENADYSKLNDFVNKSVDLLSKKYDTILKEVLSDALISGLTVHNPNYNNNLSEVIRKEVYDMKTELSDR